jgi:hypothetical protein
MNKRWMAFAIMVISIGIIVFLVGLFPLSLHLWKIKAGYRYRRQPEGTAFESMDKYMQKIASFVDTFLKKRQ